MGKVANRKRDKKYNNLAKKTVLVDNDFKKNIEAVKDEQPVFVDQKPKNKKLLYFLFSLILIIASLTTYYLIPKFNDLTVELGVDSISIAEFMKPYAIGSWTKFVTDPNEIDISKVGDTEIVLSHASREETIVLHVVDTTPPEVKVVQQLESGLTNIPSAKEFITEINDFDSTDVKFLTDVSSIKEYGNYDIAIAVTDASGNETVVNSTLSCVWLKKEVKIELGSKITADNFLLEPELGSGLIDDDLIKQIAKGGVGNYTIESKYKDKTLYCDVTVQDTTPPTLKLRNVTIYLSQSAGMNDFISAYSDASGSVSLKMNTALNLKTIGSQTVEISATDKYGNTITKKATLTVKKDDVGPVFSGLSTLTVAKHSTPNYKKGVSAKDYIDGASTFTVDTSNVNVDKAGTYFAVYRSSDTKGNVTTAKRKIVVQHNYEDTNALLDKMFASITDRSPKGICTYVKKNIEYSSSWGGSDPAWYGLTQKNGNCYVHAVILKEMLNRAGYSNQIIWVNSKAHYWNIVYYNGAWWHLDATVLRGSPPIMCNDAQKYQYVSSRGWGDWNRSAWPACNG